MDNTTLYYYNKAEGRDFDNKDRKNGMWGNLFWAGYKKAELEHKLSKISWANDLAYDRLMGQLLGALN